MRKKRVILILLTSLGTGLSALGSTLVVAGALAAVGFGSVVFHGPQPPWGQAAHDASVVVAVGATVAVAGRLVMRRRPLGIRALLPAAAVLTLGAGLRLLGVTDGAWCDPESLLQPHAGWHVLAAMGLAMVARAVQTSQIGTPPEA